MATYNTAKPQFVEVKGVKFAYLDFGTFDHWDPELINPIAATRRVILIDNSGVGKSSGTVPATYEGWAENIINVIQALGIAQIDLLGFSMGGFVAQLVTLNAPSLVRRLILAGTGPSAGEGVEGGDPSAMQRLAQAVSDLESHDAFLATFYSLSEKKQRLGDKWWHRMNNARVDRSPYLGPEGTQAQIGAVLRWANREFAQEGSYDRLHEIKIPVLVANGDNDILIPSVNSYVLFKKLVNADAHLHFFPDTGHGFVNEYADQFSKLINIFLDASD